MVMLRRFISVLHKRPATVAAVLVAKLVVLVAGLAIVPSLFPALGARSADVLRGVVGVQAVSALESASSSMRDQLNQVRFGHGVALPQISWAARGQLASGTTGNKPANGPSPTSKRGALAPATSIVTAAPQIGWQAFGPAPDGTPVMARTMLLVDPHRSYAGVALVRMDLTRLSLHMMPGIIEPAHPSGIEQAIPSLGMVPLSDLALLAAAFNGGFKSIHGHYGMMDNGFTLLPPENGIATVAIYRDGSVKMGTWNKDLFPSPDMVAFRQNCPPLIDAGQINPGLDTDASRAWGFSHNTDITWRTGLGIAQDGRTLIYAVGNGTNAKFLAQALQEAGAYYAMQLDINQYYAQFDTYSRANGQLASQRLLDQMTVNPGLFLTPSVRDFFYVTLQ
jgi:hypothetical protein